MDLAAAQRFITSNDERWQLALRRPSGVSLAAVLPLCVERASAHIEAAAHAPDVRPHSAATFDAVDDLVAFAAAGAVAAGGSDAVVNVRGVEVVVAAGATVHPFWFATAVFSAPLVHVGLPPLPLVTMPPPALFLVEDPARSAAVWRAFTAAFLSTSPAALPASTIASERAFADALRLAFNDRNSDDDVIDDDEDDVAAHLRAAAAAWRDERRDLAGPSAPLHLYGCAAWWQRRHRPRPIGATTRFPGWLTDAPRRTPGSFLRT